MQELWTVKDLSQYIKCSPWSIFSWLSQGLIPRVPGLGRMVRFDPSQIQKWLEEGGLDAARKRKAIEHEKILTMKTENKKGEQ